MNTPTERPYLWLFAILAVVGLTADQASKYAVFTWLYPADDLSKSSYVVIAGAFDFETNYYFTKDDGKGTLSFLRTISGERLPMVNRGALFGVGNEGGYNNVFMGISIAAGIFILFWALRPQVARDGMLTAALGLVLGGTLGNLYDRVVFFGVRDFLHWHGGFEWPTFNIADCCLVCGATMLVIHSFFFHEEKTPEPVKTDVAITEVTLNAASSEATLPTNGA